MFNGSGEIELAKGKIGAIKLYRFDPADKRRASLKDTILFYADYGYEYRFELDEQEFSTFVSGGPTPTTRFSVDRDGNGKVSRRFEQAAIGEAFNFTGTTYVFRLNDSVLSLEKATEEVEQMPLPPNLETGRKALEFVATTMDDVEVSFPSAYAGKIVMLDFWATWCAPCVAAMPSVQKIAQEFSDQNVMVIGVNQDAAANIEGVRAFLKSKKITFHQVLDPRGDIGQVFRVAAIPTTVVIDGTGAIQSYAIGFHGEDALRSAILKAIKATPAGG